MYVRGGAGPTELRAAGARKACAQARGGRAAHMDMCSLMPV